MTQFKVLIDCNVEELTTSDGEGFYKSGACIRKFLLYQESDHSSYVYD